jgi:HlyD family secretion protein
MPQPPGPRRRQNDRSADSRERLLAAAAAEFAARGFAGASVDRIARSARLNKAMIYYHFTSKAALYREILRDMFDAVAGRVSRTARAAADPADKIRAFVEAIAIEAEARPHFPPIWFREIAEGGAHLDLDTVSHIASVVSSLGAIVKEGVAAKRFRPVNPLLVHAGIVGPLLLFFASAGLRRRLERGGVQGAGAVDRDEVVAHVQRVALSTLGRVEVMPPTRKRPRSERGAEGEPAGGRPNERARGWSPARSQRGIKLAIVAVGLACGIGVASCRGKTADGPERASGYVEATEVRVAPEVGGRVIEMAVAEGDRVAAGAVIARLDTSDVVIARRRADAERAQAEAQLRLLQAGSRQEDVRQARAQAESAQADVQAAESELQAASMDLQRFEALLESKAGSRKQRDDAATRREVAAARLNAARERARAAAEGVGRLRAGARPEEIAGARARVAAVDAQIDALDKSIADAVLKSPVGGIVTARLADAGEMAAPRAPLVIITDLDRAWANVYVDEPIVPRLRLGQKATLLTDAGQRLDGTITFISPKAEFTPRNVQTADERSRLVYRIKVSVDNREGVLKTGMPVEAELPR